MVILKQGKALSQSKVRMLSCHTSLNQNTAYYQLNDSKSVEKEPADMEIKEEIDKVQLEFPYYGSPPVTAQLRR